ncbi:MAG: pitrilysin family protein [Silvibacterium sp.]
MLVGLLLFLLAVLFPYRLSVDAISDQAVITRSILINGMRVVLIRNLLAPVVTVRMNFLVGGDETPNGYPGMAHAQEHMAFRGCTGMTADQAAAIYAQLGDESNAETEQNVTEYYATVPATDLDVALQAQAMCLHGIEDSQADWEQERGAIEQEVAGDLSDPTYAFLNRVNADMFAGTPYAHDPLGSRASFDVTTAAMLKDFYQKWYTPSNAILVVVGDIDPAKTLKMIMQLFGSIPSHTLPPRLAIDLQPIKPETFTFDSNLGYVLGFIAYRLPGTDSADYAATQILADVLGSQRANLYALVPAGKALDVQFDLKETYPKASVGFAAIALPAAADAASTIAEMRRILTSYAKNGVPEDLVAAAKRREIAAAEFERNSIPGLAEAWSDALAAEGRTSPEEDIDAIRKVTLAEVKRVAEQYLLNASTITGIVKPVPTRKPVASKGFGGAEKIAEISTKPVQLPGWAAGALEQLRVPESYINISDTTLPNGIRLIVRTDTTSPTVTLLGSVKNNPDLQIPAGEEGLSDVLDGLYSYGTRTLNRLAFQKALDDIAADESAGYRFSLSVLKEHFSRGVQLLADNELHPALRTHAFAVTKRETSQYVAGILKSPGYRTSRALDRALLPAGDPSLREATPATLSRLTLDEVEQYRSATIRPDLTTIVVIGDVTAEDARAVIEKWFGDWEAVGPKPNTSLPAVPLNKPSARNVIDPDQMQDSVVLTEQLKLNRLDPGYYPLQLGTYVLGGGFYATRLYHDLRKMTGYVYSVDVSLNASNTRASYSVSYACSPENVSKARALIEHDINQMRTEDISAGELHQAKAILLRQTLLSESSEEILAQGMLDRAEIGLPLDEPIRAARRYAELNAQDVKMAFARAVRTDNLVQVVQGPTPQ